jgi:hypothetical protein
MARQSDLRRRHRMTTMSETMHIFGDMVDNNIAAGPVSA